MDDIAKIQAVLCDLQTEVERIHSPKILKMGEDGVQGFKKRENTYTENEFILLGGGARGLDCGIIAYPLSQDRFFVVEFEL